MPRGATPGRNTPVRGASDRLRGAWRWTPRTVDPGGTALMIGADRPFPRPAAMKIQVAGSSLVRSAICKITGSRQNG
jgi:hypothetical protein